MDAESVRRAPRGAWRWPAIIVGLLAGHVLLMGIAVLVATSDTSFQVVPDYYRKSLEWDRTQAMLRASARLGWTLRIEPGAADLRGQRDVRVTLRDANGEGVAGATVELDYLHAAQAQPQRATLELDSAGACVASLPMRASGFWQFEALARSGQTRFAARMTQYVSDLRSER